MIERNTFFDNKKSKPECFLCHKENAYSLNLVSNNDDLKQRITINICGECAKELASFLNSLSNKSKK